MTTERAVDGKKLFETTQQCARIFVTQQELLEGPPIDIMAEAEKLWEQLDWPTRDEWEARADEINESRRIP